MTSPDDPERSLTLFVPGKPAAQGSKRHVGGGRMVEQSTAVAPWRTTVAWHAAQVYSGPLLHGPIRVAFLFVMPRPAATPKSRTPPAIKRPDLDKMQRAAMDALTHVLWVDDSHVTRIVADKRLAEIGEIPGMHARITWWTNYQPATPTLETI